MGVSYSTKFRIITTTYLEKGFPGLQKQPLTAPEVLATRLSAHAFRSSAVRRKGDISSDTQAAPARLSSPERLYDGSELIA
ncbi:hypothetical protein SRHO_G00169900 [Serrasalmus rhombeus]